MRSLLPGRGQRATEIARGHAADYLVLRDLAGVLVGLAGRDERAPVAQVRLVPLMADVAEQVGPGDAVGGAHEPWVGDGAKGFADV